MRRVFRDQVALLDDHRDEFTDHGQFAVDAQFATVAVDERRRRGLAKQRLVFVRHRVLDLVDDGAGVLTALGRAGIVEVKHGRDLLGRARVIVDAARDVDGGRDDAVAIAAAERLGLGQFLMVDHGVVDDHLGDAGLLRQDGDLLKLVVLRFLFVRHGLPVGVAADLLHLVAGLHRADNLAAVGRFAQQGVDREAAAGWIGAVVVVGAVIAPLGTLVQAVLVNYAALMIFTGLESFVRYYQDAFAAVAVLARSRLPIDALDGRVGKLMVDFFVEHFPHIIIHLIVLYLFGFGFC